MVRKAIKEISKNGNLIAFSCFSWHSDWRTSSERFGVATIRRQSLGRIEPSAQWTADLCDHQWVSDCRRTTGTFRADQRIIVFQKQYVGLSDPTCQDYGDGDKDGKDRRHAHANNSA